MTTRFSDHLLEGDHASRPAATAVPAGTLYACSDHGLIYQSDGATWSTWATLGGGAPASHAASHENGGGDEIDVTGLAGAGGGLSVARKASDQAFSSTSFADSTGLTFAVAASTSYYFKYVIFFTTNATTVGIRLAINGPASPTSIVYGGLQGTGINANDQTMSTNWANAYEVALLASTTGPGPSNQAVALIEGILVNGSSAGTLALRHASETATATTIHASSFGTLVTF